MHDGEHFEQEKKKQKDQELKEIELKNQIQQYNLYTPKHESKETEYEKVNILDIFLRSLFIICFLEVSLFCLMFS